MIVSDTIRLFDEEDFSEDYPTSKVLEAVAYTFGIDPVRLRAIAEAERDGRLVVLPCKVGDPIWDIRYGEVRKHFAYQWHVVTGRPEQCFLSCEGWYFGLLDFGVTVFLTREAAEAALSAGKEDESHE